MTQKELIIKSLQEKGTLTQGDLSFCLYGDNKHLPNLYESLMKLVKDGIVIRTGDHPSYYSLSSASIEIAKKEKITKHKEIKNFVITNDIIEEAHEKVEATENYGKEDALITECFKRFPKNDDLVIIAMKIGLIDITNSTHVSQHKSKISVVELAEAILNIENIDERIKNGDPEVVNEIAKSNGKINLFSFASKYCCYHNKNLYGRDDYSILDTILKKSLPLYFNDISKTQIKKWQDSFDYKSYNDYIGKKLDELGINCSFRRRKFDHYIWFNNR